MSNLETYFGITARIDDNLEPLSYEVLEKRAIRLSKLKGFDIRKFNVYYHKIWIEEAEIKRHFSKPFAVEEKLEMLYVTFLVNPKQRHKGSIKFFNRHVDHREDGSMVYFDGEYELIRKYPGKGLSERNSIETELITFMNKQYVRRSHRKITVAIEPQATAMFETYLKTEKFIVTNLVVPLRDEVQINIREETIREEERLAAENGPENGQPAIHIELHDQIKNTIYDWR